MHSNATGLIIRQIGPRLYNRLNPETRNLLFKKALREMQRREMLMYGGYGAVKAMYVKQRGYASVRDYDNECAKRRGFKNNAGYQRAWVKSKGGRSYHRKKERELAQRHGFKNYSRYRRWKATQPKKEKRVIINPLGDLSPATHWLFPWSKYIMFSHHHDYSTFNVSLTV